MLKENKPVKEFSIGNTRIRIFNEYCRDRIPEELEAIKKNIAQAALQNLGGGNA